MPDPHASLRDEVLARVLDGPGMTEPSVRHAAADNSGVPAELRPLIEKIHTRAYTVTDADIERLRGTNDDDKLFEIIVSAALGASRKRLLAGLRALDDA